MTWWLNVRYDHHGGEFKTTEKCQGNHREIDGALGFYYLRIVITHRQQQTAQYANIRVQTGCSHIPNVVYSVHFKLVFEGGLAICIRDCFIVVLKQQLTKLSIWCIKYGAEQLPP